MKRPDDSRGDVRPWFDVRRRKLGHWAFLLHRISGLSLFIFLIFHVATVSALTLGREAYNDLITHYYTIPWLTVISLVFMAGIYHGANGLRIVIAQFSFGARRHETIFWVAMTGAILVFLYAVYEIFAVYFSEVR